MDLQWSIKEIFYERMSKTTTAVVSSTAHKIPDITSAKEAAWPLNMKVPQSFTVSGTTYLVQLCHILKSINDITRTGSLTFICPCIINIIPNYNQQDATFLDFIYFYRRSTCFRWFLRPSSGAHNCTYSFRYCQPIMLLATIVDELDLIHDSS